jgi:Tol biopolymer transport system component
MTDQGWGRAKALFQAAIERPPAERAAFVAAQAGDDDELRREVEALLASDAADRSVLERLPLADVSVIAAASNFAADETRLQTSVKPGYRIGPYEIVNLLGAGGMGQVFRARDTKLNRDVALKVLPDSFELDSDRKARFTREAHMLAALNHPNIAAIYGLEDSQDRHALILELVDGLTIADMIAHGPVPLVDAVRIARQIAEALEAAHDKGIIHRDLKPANIKVTDSGVVKVLDFGLAKVWGGAADSGLAAVPTMTSTRLGQPAVLGTPAYMSPEQARGRALDKRTDIWSFGCVLFEMLTGHMAFRGDTVSDTIARVLERDVNWAALPASCPPRIRELLRRCLQKDPGRRLRDIGDARLELEMLDDAATALADAATASDRAPLPNPGIQMRGGPLLAAGLVLVVASAALAVWVDRQTAREASAGAPVMRLTSDAGLTTDPAVSPDGRLVVYASDRAGGDNLDLWVQQIDGGTPLRLTSDPADEYEPSFSPDGTRIVFRSDRDGGGLYVVPALGGEPRLIAKGGRQPRFSPDGSRMAYVTSYIGSSQGGITKGTLFVVPAGGGTAQQIVSADVGAASPVWSPDAAHILFGLGQGNVLAWGIARSDRAGSIRLSLESLEHTSLQDLRPRDWLPGNRVLFEAKSGDSSHVFEIGLSPPSWIARAWHLDRTPRRLTFGTAQDERPAAASVASPAGGRRLVFASVLRKQNIWSVAVDAGRPAAGGTLTPLTRGAGLDTSPSVSEDGTKLAYISRAVYGDQVLLLNVKTGQTSVLTTNASGVWQPHIRADGSQVFYGDVASRPSPRERPRSIYAVSAAGGPPERICDNCDAWVWDWSPDRRWLLTFGFKEPRVVATIIDVNAKTSRMFLAQPNEDLYDFALSPDGRWVMFKTETADRSHTYIAAFSADQSPAADTWIPITDGSTVEGHPDWSPDGGWIYVLSNRDGFRCIWAYPLDPLTKKLVGSPVAVFHSHGARLSLRNANWNSQGLSVARDKIVFDRGEITGNIWMTEIP